MNVEASEVKILEGACLNLETTIDYWLEESPKFSTRGDHHLPAKNITYETPIVLHRMKAKILSKPFCFNATRSFSHHSALALWILMMMMMRCFPTLSVAPRRPFGNVIVRGYRQRCSVARFGMKVPTFSVRPCSSQVWSARQAPLVDDKHENRFLSIRGGETRPFSVARQHVDMSSDDTLHRAFIAVGSNLGDRHANIESALELLCDSNWQQHDSKNHSDAIVRLVQTSYLHETEPMYVTNQPNFLNGVVEVVTNLSPHALLRRIKHVEHALGRDFNTVRNGPRPVDLDIVLFERRSKDKELEQLVLNTPDLVIPHVGMSEREFVLKPLCELVPAETLHPVLNQTVGDLLERLLATQAASDEESSVRVLPLPRGRMLHFNETIIMGILNVTPDSFSDGGKLKGSVDTAVQAALEMEQNGAGIIDIGGESTRPGAKEILVVEEMNRTIPVIRGIRKGECMYKKVRPIPYILMSHSCLRQYHMFRYQ